MQYLKITYYYVSLWMSECHKHFFLCVLLLNSFNVYNFQCSTCSLSEYGFYIGRGLKIGSGSDIFKTQ